MSLMKTFIPLIEWQTLQFDCPPRRRPDPSHPKSPGTFRTHSAGRGTVRCRWNTSSERSPLCFVTVIEADFDPTTTRRTSP